MITIAYYALARQSEVRGGDDAARAQWWPIGEVPQLAFDHDDILRQALQRLRQDIQLGLQDEHLTMGDLQRLREDVEAVLDTGREK